MDPLLFAPLIDLVELCSRQTAATGAGAVPEWVHVMPVGQFRARDGRGPFNCDPDKVIAATRAFHGGADAAVDYDHQLVFTKDNGAGAPAAGWIKALEARQDGIWAKVDWTARAAEAIANKEYRYLSPVFMQKAGEVQVLDNVALVNNPTLHLTAIASRNPGDPMKTFLQRLAAQLGLAETADEAAIETKLTVIAGQAGGFVAAARELSLPETATADQVVVAARAALNAGAPDPSKFVPMAAHQEVASRLTTLETTLKAEAVAGAVASAKAAGKLSPALEGWATEYASRDLAGFKSWSEAAPVVVGPADLTRNGGPGDAALDAADREVCARMGVDPEAYKKMRGS
ncbi:MAG: phage protease [Ferrovibrionaceae bacterium]